MTKNLNLDSWNESWGMVTPAPWTVEGWDNESFMSTCGVRAGERVLLTVCNCEDAPNPTDADLNLIALAPEMALLLRRVGRGDYGQITAKCWDDIADLLARIGGDVNA